MILAAVLIFLSKFISLAFYINDPDFYVFAGTKIPNNY